MQQKKQNQISLDSLLSEISEKEGLINDNEDDELSDMEISIRNLIVKKPEEKVKLKRAYEFFKIINNLDSNMKYEILNKLKNEDYIKEIKNLRDWIKTSRLLDIFTVTLTLSFIAFLFNSIAFFLGHKFLGIWSISIEVWLVSVLTLVASAFLMKHEDDKITKMKSRINMLIISCLQDLEIKSLKFGDLKYANFIGDTTIKKTFVKDVLKNSINNINLMNKDKINEMVLEEILDYIKKNEKRKIQSIDVLLDKYV